jgi:hypothetical protein
MRLSRQTIWTSYISLQEHGMTIYRDQFYGDWLVASSDSFLAPVPGAIRHINLRFETTRRPYMTKRRNCPGGFLRVGRGWQVQIGYATFSIQVDLTAKTPRYTVHEYVQKSKLPGYAMVELTQAVRASVGRQVASNGHNPLNFRLRDWKLWLSTWKRYGKSFPNEFHSEKAQRRRFLSLECIEGVFWVKVEERAVPDVVAMRSGKMVNRMAISKHVYCVKQKISLFLSTYAFGRPSFVADCALCLEPHAWSQAVMLASVLHQ